MFLLLALFGIGEPAAAQGKPLPQVPGYLPAVQRDSLQRAKDSLEARETRFALKEPGFTAQCGPGRILATDTPRIAACRGELEKLQAEIAGIQKDKKDFVTRIATLSEPPAPVIDEAAEFFQEPIGWYERQALRVRHAVFLNKKWTGEVLKAIDGLTPLPPTAKVTRLSALSPGDVLLIAPMPLQHDPKEYVKGELISFGDYGLRAITAFADGGLAKSSGVQRADISHQVTFVRNADGHMIFLDHDMKGTRIVDEVAFLKEYGAREMLVARPQDVVDGRMLWSAASILASKKTGGYGVTGTKVVCSELSGIAVARATGVDYSAGNIGPIDVTPGDFYDKRGNVGKHFVVTRLMITPSTEAK